jgi:hypothetical protein
MKLLGMSIFFVVFIGCTSTQTPSQNKIEIPEISIDEYSGHLMHYFENKNDEIIYETISIYKNDNYIAMLDKIDSIIIFFFYGIKIDNQERYNNFLNLIKYNNIQRLIEIFEIIENNDLETYILNHEIVPQINDNYWTLYFSSGNIKYLDRIIDFVNEYNNESEQLSLYMTARSGIWSFMLNIRTYPAVLNYIQNNAKLSNEIKSFILSRTINDLEKETNEFLRIQKEKGIW